MIQKKKNILSACNNFADTVFRKHISNNDFSEDTHEVKPVSYTHLNVMMIMMINILVILVLVIAMDIAVMVVVMDFCPIDKEVKSVT